MTKITVYTKQEKNPINPWLLGHFVEQFPGNIPDGIYMPGHPLSDEDGFRRDVLEKMREAGVTQLRWAGNFSSHYHWMDGVGEKNKRPVKVNFAWDTEEDNGHGTAEFIKLCRKAGAEPVIGVNMGSGTPEEAMNWVEYCNGSGNTFYANLRRQHGYEEPFGVKYWCLGNEMYAQWQFGCLSAQEYAKKAVHFAYAMRKADPSIKLTAVGLETDPEWNYEVVKKLCVRQVPYAPCAGDYIDYISAHYYPIGMEAAYENAGYETRMTLGEFYHERTRLLRNAIENAEDDSQSRIRVVWDEWHPIGQRDGTEFTLEGTLWSALILNSFIRDSAWVEMANYTFFVGGNGPIQVTDKGLAVQPDYYLFKLYSQALGDNLLQVNSDCETITVNMPSDRRWPQYGRPEHKKREIPLLDISASGKKNGQVTLIVNNLSRDKDIEAEIVLEEGSFTNGKLSTIWNEDLRADNTENPDNVKIESSPVACDNNRAKIMFLRHSVNAVVFYEKEQ